MSTVAELEVEFRRRASDVATPSLYTSADFLASIREAETEACRRGLILRDATTDPICGYFIEAGEPWVDLDSRVLKVTAARMRTPNLDDPTIVERRDLSIKVKADLEWNWREDEGDPDCIVTDLETGRLRLVPRPTRDSTLRLDVVRLPLEPMADADASPEIPARYHLQLVPWALFRCFGNDDTELHRPKFAADALAEFEASFGPPVSANDDLWVGLRSNPRRSHTRFY